MFGPCSVLQLQLKTCVKRPLSKRLKIGFQDQSSLNAGQKYCRMLQREEHSAILSTFIKLIFVIFILTKSEGYSFGVVRPSIPSVHSVRLSTLFVLPEPYLSTYWSDLIHSWYKLLVQSGAKSIGEMAAILDFALFNYSVLTDKYMAN